MFNSFDITALPPEERDFVTQLGKISRPFAHDPRDPLVKRTINLARALFVAAEEWEVFGVDVSYWQGKIDFTILRLMAMFVIIRYGIGNASRDTNAERNVAGAIEVNMPYGGYWYLKPAHNWEYHAQSFYSAISDFGSPIYSTDDFEENGGKDKSSLESWLQKYSNKKITLLVNAGLIKGEAQSMWYTSKNVCDNMLPNPNGWMRDNQLDVAHWTTAPQPLIPNEWVVAGKTWKFWQHAVVDAAGYGVESAKIDLQRYNGTRAQFQAEFGVTLPPPPEPQVPAYIRVNVAELNIRNIHDDPIGNASILGKTTYGKVWKTTGVQFADAKGRGWWIQVSDEHGQVLWLAGWLCVPA